MQLLVVISCCLTGLCLVPPALDWRSPILSSVRAPAFAVLTALPLCLAVIQGWMLKNSRPGQRAIRCLAVVGILAAATALTATLLLECNFHRIRTEVRRADPERLEKLGRHLFVGYRDPAEARELVRLRGIAGLFISSRNVRGWSIARIREEIRSFQSLRRQQGLPPLWIATDQEGGIVSRMSPPLVRQPPLSQILKQSSDISRLERTVRQYARTQGLGLADLGVNLNFAPVVDLNHQVVNPLDRLTRIRERAISGDPAVVAQVAGWYCEALEKTGVRCTLKHFPGLGRVYEDTHTDRATLNTSIGELNATDWVPFRALMSKSAAFTMLGHVRLGSMDTRNGASFSPGVVSDLIRGYWKYDGVLITDNFTMMAVYRSACGIENASIRAINAGVDLILISYDTDQYYRVMYALLEADRQGKLAPEALTSSDRRLARSMLSIQRCRKDYFEENSAPDGKSRSDRQAVARAR